jgi:hypothetical protein
MLKRCSFVQGHYYNNCFMESAAELQTLQNKSRTEKARIALAVSRISKREGLESHRQPDQTPQAGCPATLTAIQLGGKVNFGLGSLGGQVCYCSVSSEYS